MKKLLLGVLSLACLLTITGCALPGLSGAANHTIRIGTLATSESEIWGNMLSIMIERETDLNTELITDLGSSIVQHQGMVNDELDLTATRYTGTDISGALGMEPVTDPKRAMEIVKREFPKRFDQTWGDSYGFENSYSVAVTKKFADENNIETISDLAPFADDLVFGVDNSWINRKGDGYEGFKDKYFEFGKVYPMNTGLVYQAAASGHMDVVLAYSSDGRIKQFDLKVLKDDKYFFPPYDASPVVRNEVIKKYPQIKKIMDKLAGTITTEEMQDLNYAADVKLESPRKVANEFLKKHHYFETNQKEES